MNLTLIALLTLGRIPVADVSSYKVAGGVLTTGSAENRYIAEPAVIYDGSTWKMWAHVLSSDASSDDVHYFTSPDAITWTRHGLVLSGVFRPFVIYVPESARPYWLYGVNDESTQAKISLFTSADGLSWTLDTDALLTTGAGWDAGAVANPYVWREGASWFMLYESGKITVNTGWQLGLATSTDGRTWTKDAQNPIDITGFAQQQYVVYSGPSVVPIGGVYYMLFHGKPDPSNGSQFPSDVYLARSAGTGTAIEKLRGPWSLVGSDPVLPREATWEGAGSSDGQLADPCAVVVGGSTYIFYEGIQHQWSGTSPAYRIGLVQLPGTLDQVGPVPPGLVLRDRSGNALTVRDQGGSTLAIR